MNMSPVSPVLPRMIVAGDQQPGVREVARLMRSHLRTLLGITACVTALAVAYALFATPIYSSDVLVRVDSLDPNAFGTAPQGQALAPPSAPPTDAEIEIMGSRSVLDPVIQQYKFDVLAVPHRLPLLGKLTQSFATPGVPERPWFWMDTYAWGGEQIDVAYFKVPPQWEDKRLDLRAGPDGAYQVFDPSGALLVSGTVGQPAQGRGISMLIKSLVARPGTRFDLTGSNEINTVRHFKSSLKVVDDGKDTGVVRITFTDRDPTVATDVANAVAASYIANSVASRQFNDSRTLAFIQQELPRLRTELQQAEVNLAQFRISSGSMDPTTEAPAYLQGGIDFVRQIALLQVQRIQLLQSYTPSSPEVQNVDRQLAQLNTYKDNFDARFNGMPASARQNADLTRRAKVAEGIYTAMVAKAEELSVRRASTAGGAHIVDYARRPSLPIKPNRLLVILGGLLLGLIAAAAYIFIRYEVMGGVTDPLFVEQYLNVPLFGVLTFSPHQAALEHEERRARAGSGGESDENPLLTNETPRLGPAKMVAAPSSLPPGSHRLLARSFPQDISMESLRRVRTAMSLEMNQAPNKIVAVTGPTMATGKSFVAANFAALQAETGSRVLLIDADMRCGRLASFFKLANATGLADVLRGRVAAHSALKSTGIPNLSLMSCGTYPSNPSELLMMPAFSQLLTQLEAHYDFILLDTPPFLPVTDAAIVARHAGATLLVLRSGMQSKQQVEDTVKGLDRTGARLVGAVFNAISSDHSADYYGNQQYARYVVEPANMARAA